ncbi:MAG: thioesterase [Pseudomonadales bacterium]|nr:thioesterase [Pseudomonadales bacterium]
MALPTDGVESGFVPHFRKSKFTDPWEPLYSRLDDSQIRLGVVLHDVHCNSRGLVHGAFLAAIADNAIGLCCGHVLKQKGFEYGGLVTTNLSIDYVGMAKVGQWISTDIEVVKTGKTLCVANCIISSSKGPIARANATFQVV